MQKYKQHCKLRIGFEETHLLCTCYTAATAVTYLPRNHRDTKKALRAAHKEPAHLPLNAIAHCE